MVEKNAVAPQARPEATSGVSGNHRFQRRDYGGTGLRRSDLAGDPLMQFSAWLDAAIADRIADPTAMALATVGADRSPSVRIVLLKHFDAQGLCWYTDYRSAKGAQLAENPLASVLFHWREQDRQVRISGSVQRLSATESDAYFESRPLHSRYAAAASLQSAPIADRQALERAVRTLRLSRAPEALTRPPEWGGYRLRPAEYEFWQGRPGRLHDRFRYRQDDAGHWGVARLQP